MGQGFGLRQRGLTILICLVTSDEKKKIKFPTDTLKLKPEHHFSFLANSSWNHLSGLAGTVHKAMIPQSGVFLWALFGSQ